MMLDGGSLRFRNLGGADVEPAIQLHGIAVDDLTLKFLRDPQRERAFSSAGRTYDCNKDAGRGWPRVWRSRMIEADILRVAPNDWGARTNEDANV
jgi:hypothetical protein